MACRAAATVLSSREVQRLELCLPGTFRGLPQPFRMSRSRFEPIGTPVNTRDLSPASFMLLIMSSQIDGSLAE